jgi:hypothetical protein
LTDIYQNGTQHFYFCPFNLITVQHGYKEHPRPDKKKLFVINKIRSIQSTFRYFPLFGEYITFHNKREILIDVFALSLAQTLSVFVFQSFDFICTDET